MKELKEFVQLIKGLNAEKQLEIFYMLKGATIVAGKELKNE